MEPIRIFIAYSRKDEAYLKDLRTYLRPIERNHSIETWSDENILAGKPWEKEIKDNLHAADIILLLVSANSLASDYFYEKEMADALVRHDKGEAVVVSIILDHCAWEITPINYLQVLPKDGKPIVDWLLPSKAYKDIVLKLEERIRSVLEKRAEEQAEIQQEEEDKLQSQKETAEEQKRKTVLKQNPNTRYAAMGTGFFLCLLFWGLLQIRSFNLKSISSIENQDTTVINAQANTEIDTTKEENLLSEEVRDELENTTEKEGGEPENKHSHKYIHWLNVADTKYNQEDWEAAKEDYQEAAKYESTEYVKDRIAAIDWRLKEEEKRKKHPEIQKLVNDMISVKGDILKGWNDGNVYKVMLSDYIIGKYEVTQGQWEAVMDRNPSKASKNCPKCPVENVSWDDAQEFIKKLNQLTGQKFRLPTDMEWEFAAIGGIKSQGYEYAGGNDLEKVAWCQYNSDSKTHPVGTKKANELGLYDMSGNVGEWCSDRGDNHYQNSIRQEPNSINLRVVRGGSWSGVEGNCSSRDYRSIYKRNYGDYYAGFRLARTL